MYTRVSQGFPSFLLRPFLIPPLISITSEKGTFHNKLMRNAANIRNPNLIYTYQ